MIPEDFFTSRELAEKEQITPDTLIDAELARYCAEQSRLREDGGQPGAMPPHIATLILAAQVRRVADALTYKKISGRELSHVNDISESIYNIGEQIIEMRRDRDAR
jgi:hypothetical protein